jgi:hypothetical protein
MLCCNYIPQARSMMNLQALQLVQMLSKLQEFTAQQLSEFSHSENFEHLVNAAVCKESGSKIAKKLRSQLVAGDISQFPGIEIVSGSTIGNANGIYDISTNRIYLSDTFVGAATTQTLIRDLRAAYEQVLDRSSSPDRATIVPELSEGNLNSLTPPAFISNGAATIQNASGIQQSTVGTSSNSRINALLSGYKWGGTTITYSFYNGGAFYGDEQNVASVSNTVKQNVRNFLKNAIEPLINIKFVEVADSPTSSPNSYGQIRYFLADIAPDYAYARYPSSTDANQGNINDLAGDVFLSTENDTNSDTNGFQGGPGTHGYSAIIHETLHALGLKHPGDYNGDGAGEGPFLPYGEDNLDNSIMSYNFEQGAEAGTPMPYDILALQYLYGAKSFNASNTTYKFEAVDYYTDDNIRRIGSNTADVKLTIWDTGGIDTLDFSQLVANSTGYHFDLNQGGWLSTETAFNGERYTAKSDPSGTNYVVTFSGTRIGFGVAIEKAIGTASDDTFYGNSLDNYFSGKLGSDDLYGGVGNDVAIYVGTSAQYQIINTGRSGEFRITDSIANRDGVDSLSSIERIQFSDKTILLNSIANDNNDNFANRITLTGNIATATGFNNGATGETGEPNHAGSANPLNSRWWSWTATAAGTVTISTAGSNFDTVLGVYTGNSVASLTTVASNDDAQAGVINSSKVTFTAIAGTTYQIAVDGFQAAAVGNIKLGLNFTPTATPTVVKLAAAPVSVNEDGAANLVYTFTRTGNLASALSVGFGVGGTALFNSDYTQAGAASFATATGGTINFAAGANTAKVTIDPKADTMIEANETVALTLKAGAGYSVGTTTPITTTILNDDTPRITLTAIPTSVTENGAANLVYTFTRTGNLASALSVGFGVGGTALFNSDYTQSGAASFATVTGGTINFAAGANTAKVTIDPKADTMIEANETVALTLKAGKGYAVGTPMPITTTILNDDIARAKLAAAPVVSNDLVMKVEKLNSIPPVATGVAANSEGEVLDLGNFADRILKVDTQTVSNSGYNNYISCYAVEDRLGTLANGLKVSDAGYAAAAIKSAVLRSSRNETQVDRTVAGGKILAPVAIANGTFEDLLDRSPHHQASSDVRTYSNYMGANVECVSAPQGGRVDRFQSLGANQFGIDGAYGVDEPNHNDLVFQVKIHS